MSRFLRTLLAPCLLLTALCLLFAGTALSQTTNATLTGVVEDQDGNAVPGAKVSIMNPATGLIRNVTTDSSGAYVVPLLPPATYTVMAEANGFKRIQFPDVVLNVNDRRSLRIRLEVGDVTGVVEVRPDASLVDSESGAVATTVDRTFVGNLPLSGRSLQTLILLTPGVVYTPAQPSEPGEFSVNGQRSNANYFTVDGVAANTGANPNPAGNAVTSNQASGMLPGLGANGSTSALVSVDALEEFKIQTSTYSAQFGRQPGAQVQLSTRSGTNDFRGTIFEYIRNEAFDANNWFNNAAGREKPPTRLNQYGGTFSGPLYLPRFGEGGPSWYSGKDRTFFFFSFEGQRLRLPDSANLTVPSIRIRQLASAPFGEILNAFPLPTGDEISVSCDPDTPGCLPDGTRPSGVAPFLATFSNPKSQDATSIRVDHRISDKHVLFGRFNYAPSDSLSRNLAQLSGTVAENKTLTLGLNSSLMSNISNEFRFNHTRSRAKGTFRLDNFGGAVPIDVSRLLPGYTGELENVLGGFALFTPGGAARISIGDFAENRLRQYNLVNNLTWIAGNHALVFGIDHRRLAPVLGPLQYEQNAFAGYSTHEQEIAFHNGSIIVASVGGQGAAVHPRFDNFSAYVQDTWKVSRRLTIDLGLRWELNLTPSEANGRNPVFVTDVENIENARLLRPDESWYKTNYAAIAPRFGAAYLLRQKAGQETVLRGGFGVYYDLNSGLATAAYSGFPFVVTKQVCCNITWPITPEQAALPDQAVPILPITDTLYALNEDLDLPYTLQWNVSAEQSLGKSQTLTVGYVASAGRRLTTNQQLNQQFDILDPDSRPNPNFGTINYVTNGPTSDYHSMQVQYQRRLSQGLQALVNYTWSHAIDEVSNEFQQGTLVRGNASFDIRHNFTAAFTYDVPRWKRYSVLDAILRDWSMDTIILAYSGRPLDITTGRGNLVDDNGNWIAGRPDVVPGVPIWIEDETAPGGRRINVNAFTHPPIGDGSAPPFALLFARQGTLGRNVVRESGIHQVNFSLRRQFGLTEHMKLQVRAEAFNIFNTPLFSGYNTRFFPGSTEFGLATTTLNNQSFSGGVNSLYALGGPRSMQFSVRLSF